jgi:hypothetical protein
MVHGVVHLVHVLLLVVHRVMLRSSLHSSTAQPLCKASRRTQQHQQGPLLPLQRATHPKELRKVAVAGGLARRASCL